jgi:endonuclease/exonuclease/phosphatase family metal-dependent hydrolase
MRSPTRLSIVTYNIWLTERWPARAPALERFLTLFTPDVLCVQELQRTTQEFLDRVLGGYARVHDPFPGWTNESNIYWNEALLEGIEHGAEEVGHAEPERRMFWARLRIKSSQKPIFVATAHLTSPRHGDERETGVSPRVGQLKKIAGRSPDSCAKASRHFSWET